MDEKPFFAVYRVMIDIIRNFLFADDCALNAAFECDMQRSVDKFAAAYSNFGLTISTKRACTNQRQII